MKITQPLKYTLVVTTTALLMLSMTVFAAPFTPGQTLDPGCNPGAADCYVTESASNGLTKILGDTKLGGVLDQSTIIDTNGNEFEIIGSNASFLGGPIDVGGGTMFNYTGLFKDLGDGGRILSGVLDLSFVPGLGHEYYAVYTENNEENDITLFAGGSFMTSALTDGMGGRIRTAGVETALDKYDDTAVRLYTTYNNTTGPENEFYLRINDGIDADIRSGDFSVNIIGGTTQTFGISSTGVSFNEYTLPWTDGSAGRVLQTDGLGEVSWQNSATGTLPAYANDATAGGAGLSTGEYYQTDGTGAAPLNVPGIVMIKQ